ncbi:ribonuclease [Reticulomyxa filosa]|uniref:Ribonuclease n=1 Tax=Reticulomyxa filosa TaxID=46433 RepID=X6PAZ9_RETFI|nr:ribonuclease [Reticulomyxa filosa]|eukprot:ETO35326.1 ribonuclease [Reticulomyxa filosa]
MFRRSERTIDDYLKKEELELAFLKGVPDKEYLSTRRANKETNKKWQQGHDYWKSMCLATSLNDLENYSVDHRFKSSYIRYVASNKGMDESKTEKQSIPIREMNVYEPTCDRIGSHVQKTDILAHVIHTISNVTSKIKLSWISIFILISSISNVCLELFFEMEYIDAIVAICNTISNELNPCLCYLLDYSSEMPVRTYHWYNARWQIKLKQKRKMFIICDDIVAVQLLQDADEQKNDNKAKTVKGKVETQQVNNLMLPYGHYNQTIGKTGDFEVQTQCLLIEHNILNTNLWSDAVLQCLPRNVEIPESERNNLKRRDIRHLCVFSVDPLGCTDIDDALHCLELDNGSLEIGVHIADVAFYVKNGTPLDNEASKRYIAYLVD